MLILCKVALISTVNASRGQVTSSLRRPGRTNESFSPVGLGVWGRGIGVGKGLWSVEVTGGKSARPPLLAQRGPAGAQLQASRRDWVLQVCF
jgi:hypothetical protein